MTTVRAMLLLPKGTSSVSARDSIWAEGFVRQEGHDHVEINGIGSRVRIDRDVGLVSKLYRPKKWLQAFYWLCFQGPFPYRSNEHALRAAELRRNIADAILEYEIGPGLVALPHRHPAHRKTIDTDYVVGSAPRDRKRARQFLSQVTAVFLRAGLPTWQVAPWQPRAIGNVMEKPDGRFELIDLESNLVSPFLPLSQAAEFLDQGIWPTFDDINMLRLRHYLEQEEAGLRKKLGERRRRGLREQVDLYEEEVRAWRVTEPRLLSRSVQAIYRILTFPLTAARAGGFAVRAARSLTL